jgi:6-phosphofructokinase 1
VSFFLSYGFDDEPFVQLVNYFLRKQPALDSYCYAEDKRADSWEEQLIHAIAKRDTIIVFLGQRWGKVQPLELAAASKKAKLLVTLPGAPEAQTVSIHLAGLDPIIAADLTEAEAGRCAREIIHRSGRVWVPVDFLTIGYPFDSEKKIIKEYLAGNGTLDGKRLEQGCPAQWPEVEKYWESEQEGLTKNPIAETIIGAYRRHDAGVIADTSTTHIRGACSNTAEDRVRQQFVFPEAGPREFLMYPEFNTLSVGILVSGGIAPGINAVIDGIVSRHRLYANEGEGERYALKIRGYREGFKPLLSKNFDLEPMDLRTFKGHAESGGSLLGTSRADEFMADDPRAKRKALDQIVKRLRFDQIDILYVIGGDGSMRAAHAIWKTANESQSESDRRLSVVGVPKTMDNDILWVWQAFGFLSAVEKAREAILSLHTETTSNPRLGIVQLFGSDSGFVASNAALASGACDLVLIPEVHFSMAVVSDYIRRRLTERFVSGSGGSPHGLIVMAETAIPVDVELYLDDEEIHLTQEEKAKTRAFLKNNMRVFGQTPDDLRSAGLKILARVLERNIKSMKNPYWRGFRVVTNEPRHLIRSVAPSVSDVIFAERLGTLAVDNAMAGYTDFMVSQWKTEFVLVPLKLVVLGRKRVPEEGMFWKSVSASTGQPIDLVNMPPRRASEASNSR